MFPMLLDRVVCILLFTALSTLALELTGLGPQALKDSKIYVRDNVTVYEINETVEQPPASPVPVTRSEILDNIFKIPIVTLSAVSDLVQSIALGFNGGGQQAGGGAGGGPRGGGHRAVHGPLRHVHHRHAYIKSTPIRKAETAAAA